MELNLRKAECNEAEELTLLAQRAKASWGYPEAWLREWELVLVFSAEYIDRNVVIVAIIDESIVGVIALENANEPEISHLWVSPEHQRLGIGRRLVECAREVARANGWTSLRVEADPNAQPFYERLGAVQVGKVLSSVANSERVLPVLRLPM